MKRQKETRRGFFEGLRRPERTTSRVRPNARTTKYLRKEERRDIFLTTYLSQERQASVSQACKEFVERVAGRIRHRRMQGREESEEGLDIVEGDEDDEDMADMENGILVRCKKGRLAKST